MVILCTGNFIKNNESPSYNRVNFVTENLFKDYNKVIFISIRFFSFYKIIKIIFDIVQNKYSAIYIYNKSLILNSIIGFTCYIFKRKSFYDQVEFGENRGFLKNWRVLDEVSSILLPIIFKSNLIYINKNIKRKISFFDKRVNSIYLPPGLSAEKKNIISKTKMNNLTISEKISVVSKNKYEDDLRFYIKKLLIKYPKESIQIVGCKESKIDGVKCKYLKKYGDYIKELLESRLIIVPRRGSRANSFSSPNRYTEIIFLEKPCLLPENLDEQISEMENVVYYNPYLDSDFENKLTCFL